MNMENYKIIEFNNPGIDWCGSTQELFSKITKLKIDGYQHEYGQNVMPMSSHDYFSSHIIICEEKDNDLFPLAISKVTKYSLCQYFNQPFPPIELVRKGGNEKLAVEIESIIKDTIDKYGEITYDSSWTIRPDIRNTRANTIVIRMMLAEWINYHIDSALNDFLVSATLKVGTDKIFLTTGCEPISDDPYYQLIEVDNQKAMMLHCMQISDKMLYNASKYRSLWDNRIVIGEQVKVPVKQIV